MKGSENAIKPSCVIRLLQVEEDSERIGIGGRNYEYDIPGFQAWDYGLEDRSGYWEGGFCSP
jgi:hypothetical protein